MKNLKIKALVAIFIMVAVLSTQAQAPYKHSIGVTAGTLNAVSYKTFFSDNIAFQADLGYKCIVTSGQHANNIFVQSFELNPNIMYEKDITKGLYLFGGGGLSLGYSWMFDYYYYYSYRYDLGKFGINAIAGVEYKFNIPLTLQADFRPGYGLLFGNHTTWNYFDWALCASVRYTF